VADFIAVRKGLLAPAAPQNAAGNWRAILRKHRINHIVVYSSDRLYTEAVFSGLASNGGEWPLLYMKKGAAIFGWRDPKQPPGTDRLAALPLNLDRLAFAPAPGERAPATWPGREPQPYRWWDAFWKPQFSPSADLDEAALALVYHDALKDRYFKRNHQACSNFLIARLVTAGGSLGSPSMDYCLWSPTFAQCRKLFFMSKDQGPRGAAYLAVRAVRRALHAGQTDNPRAYLLLGKAYDELTNSREQAWQANNPMLAKLRAAQISYAYNQALSLDPNLEEAHARIEGLYRTMGYKDLTVKHMREVLRINRAGGPRRLLFPDGPRLETAREFSERLTKLAEIIKEREQDIEKNVEDFDQHKEDLKIFDRAQFAVMRGLAGKALEILLKSEIAAFGKTGMDLELRLLLSTGQMDKVRAWMTPEQEKDLGTAAYREDRVQLGAATGDYQAADEDLKKTVTKFPGIVTEPIPMRTAFAFVLGYALLDCSDNAYEKMTMGVAKMMLPQRVSMLPDRTIAPFFLGTLAQSLNNEAEIHVLRGLLAVEAGNMDRARECFQDAKGFWDSPAYHAMRSVGLASLAGAEITTEMLSLLRQVERN
jgi:hypothetical protein